MNLERRLPATMQAPAEARRSVEQLAEKLEPECLEVVRLLVSELVTNSVRHAGLRGEDWVDLTLQVTKNGVRAAITDRGEGFQAIRRQPAPGSTSGWGLFLLDELADSWGVSGDGSTRVWFEIVRRPAPAPSASELSSS
ncbi:MAG TPA: ATP-binding protein [Actinomycetota bacterium]|nr:ATP-binding protein [Actinomycetota bacterium]